LPGGGWPAPRLDEVAGGQVGAAYEGTDALMLGRRTYDIFAAYWPYQEGGQDNEIATLFNSVPKYVASRGRPDLSWAGSTRLGPDLAGAVREIRDRHEHVKVVGSLNLVQTLLREKLFDRLDLWLHPVVLGVGKKVFDGGAGGGGGGGGGCPRTPPPPTRRSPVRRAPCTCATGSPMARPGRGT